MPVNYIADKIFNGERITEEEYLELDVSSDFLNLGIFADSIRQKKHPEKIVTYVIDRNINYTDICISECKFCAFFKKPEDTDGYLLSFDELSKKIEETKALGGTQILLQGGLHPTQPLEYYEELLRFIKNLDIHVHGFSPPEIVHFAKISGETVAQVIKRLIAAGLDSIPGGGAEILCDRVRKAIAPNKCTADEWLSVMEEAHHQGLRTSATMMFGHIETRDERLQHLRRLRELQDRTGGFTAFIPWPFQPGNSALSDIRKTTAVEYLRMVALSRIFLDNFENIQASWVTQGPKVAQLSLSFGANDFGSTMIEENVVAAAGVSFRLSQEEICKLVDEAGFTPAQRLMNYTLYREGISFVPADKLPNSALVK